ncbi:uncharacterized protein Z519_10603 [Cladophialophora bantiana CBS 173.52]|uniref:2-dehydropantoate 2-reductase n=1 Tax=Cladophialophora bantiana (strain ATCC 10958 / CBS 173.52 / CDC B-1940 / NIH 8579) TaxID=1442370 RepID=A0A0D2FPM6_CLAB1|nr:uncharacterized protein Z519_10603 [Cladophialophora bantiana CBS 173.52]KIW88557.1 hypothetical protein Z519_10603 [Cladophialophora bantiana CBS 173.52]
MASKANTLLIGCGGIGTISALNLEVGGRATVTAVLRSNFQEVSRRGFDIRSVDHGVVKGFKPTKILNAIPDVARDNLTPYKYIICATKNYPDVPPTVVDLLRPAVTPGHSVVVLIQNGLNIEKPLLAAFPQNVILSGVSFCGSHEIASGEILHEDSDKLFVGAFRNPTLDPTLEDLEAQEFTAIYCAGGKCVAEYQPDVGFTRWRKLLYNACLNSICAITDLDTGRLQLADGMVENLARPAMEEICAAAKAFGHDLPADLVDFMITMDPITMYNPPSMQVDVRKGRFIEFENIVGEPVREGTSRGVPMPILTVYYHILRSLQWKLKEKKGLVTIPAPFDHTNTLS